MKKEEIFFGENGLTSTSASHVKNLSKEYVASVLDEISSVRFVNTEISVIGSGSKELLSSGFDAEHLNRIPAALEIISKAYALNAWLGEAIKAKESMTSEIKDMKFEQWCSANDIELPVEPDFPCEKPLSHFESFLSVADRCRYYALEATVSAYGKYIHPSGPFASARKDMQKRISEPRDVKGNGRDTIIYSYEPSCRANLVEDTFFELQAKHREYQAELNSMKYKLETERQKEYNMEIKEYDLEIEDYNMRRNEIFGKFSEWKSNSLRRVQELKIVIPDRLKQIYDVVTKLGK